MADIAGQILKGSQDGHKRYAFDDQHDPTQPAQYWFQESNDGLGLFVVFYTQACRWSRCRGRNLRSKSSIVICCWQLQTIKNEESHETTTRY